MENNNVTDYVWVERDCCQLHIYKLKYNKNWKLNGNYVQHVNYVGEEQKKYLNWKLTKTRINELTFFGIHFKSLMATNFVNGKPSGELRFSI